MSLYRQGEAEALESFPYGQICSYGVSDSNTFKITAGDRDLLFETTKVFRRLLPLPGSIAGFYGLTASLRSKCAPFIPSILETRRIPVHNLFWFPNHN